MEQQERADAAERQRKCRRGTARKLDLAIARIEEMQARLNEVDQKLTGWLDSQALAPSDRKPRPEQRQ